MRVIKPETGLLVYKKIFQELINKTIELVVWQLMPNGTRQITEVHLDSIDLESGFLYLNWKNSVRFQGHLPMYFYVEDGQFIFKSHVHEIRVQRITVQVPPDIRLLEGSEIEDIQKTIGRDYSEIWKLKHLQLDTEAPLADFMKVTPMAERSNRDKEFLKDEFGFMSLDEEDKLFADKRESPRARPKTDKRVKVAKSVPDSAQSYKLFDLSQGGMAFITDDEASFLKGIDVQILGFDEFDLDAPLVGTVMSIRPVDENNSEFKVGIKFSEGQS